MRFAGRRVENGICESMDEALKSCDEFDGKNNEFITKHLYHTDIIIESNEDMSIREPDGRALR
jgi:hypothetical protein